MLRQARPGDAPAIADVFLATRRATMAYLPDVHTDEQTRRWIAEVVVLQEEVWVAEARSVLVGFAALSDTLLEHLYVLPEHHSRGIGSALLAKAKELRPNGFRLWVFQRNEQARRFYEARGLRLVERTDGSGNEEREPDALYEWRP